MTSPDFRPTRFDDISVEDELTALLRVLRTTRPARQSGTRKRAGKARAVLYLRVSSRGQLETDFGADGLSIPAQEEAGRAKADDLDAEVVRVFIDRAETGTKIENRKDLIELLRFLRQDGNVDYVIVPKLDRFARDVGDDAMLDRWVRKQGAELVSCAEQIGTDPSGQLVRGVHALIAQFYSANLRTEVIKGMRQKVKNGGTPGRAKLGYTNVQADAGDGRKVRTIGLDEERARLIGQAFAWMESGRFTLESLHEQVTKAGLTTRPERNRPERPISRSQLHRILRDRYYTGRIEFEGEWIEARHQAIVSDERFDRVQRVLDAHSGSGIRQRRHDHYLKGAINCHRCGHRLIIDRGVGKGGVYFYFICRGRQLKKCDQPYMLVEEVERAVERHYLGRRFAPELAAAVRERFSGALNSEVAALEQVKVALRGRLDQLDQQEDAYLALVGNPKWPQAKLEAKIASLRAERDTLEADLAKTASELDVGRQTIGLALDFLTDPHTLYTSLSETGRRLLNTIFFGTLSIDVEFEGVNVARSTTREPFKSLLKAQEAAAAVDPKVRAYGRLSDDLSIDDLEAQLWPENESRGSVLTDAAPAWDELDDAALLLVGLSDAGWSKAALVEVAGIEPASFGEQSGLLRAQRAVVFSAPPVTHASRCRAQSLCDVPYSPVTGKIGEPPGDASIPAGGTPGLTAT